MHTLPKVKRANKAISTDKKWDRPVSKSEAKPLNTVTCKKCGSTIFSKSRHDFQTCNCGSISVDGGQDYTRYIGDPADFVKYPLPLPKKEEQTRTTYDHAKGCPNYHSTSPITEECGKYHCRTLGSANTVSYTSTWTVGNGQACDGCRKVAEELYSLHIASLTKRQTLELNGRPVFYCAVCIPSPKWTVSKWVEVVKGSAQDVAFVTLLGWLLLMSFLACFTLVYAVVAGV